MNTHPLAGKPAPKSILVNVPELISAYFTLSPDPQQAAERISFGTSGHRGSSLKKSFNQAHILAVTQAVCEYRQEAGIDGILFMGMDTHPLSWPAQFTALQVLVANKVDVRIAAGPGEQGFGYFGYTPTPVISHAILTHNRNSKDSGKTCDGIVITPSHNPPVDGGFKYNPPHGGPADTDVTQVIEARANQILEENLAAVKTVPLEEALKAENVELYDYITPYVNDLDQVLDMQAIAQANIRIGADAMGGAGMAYWQAIKERYGLNMAARIQGVNKIY
ncbi:MAG: phosphoglucomutase, alpha-D-glucose phosphate-specific, partial [Candidatus Electrothrix sp. AW1]|nr:phosphoglucomutase, alpha-D-glucose phosphate-specific [Candidatus Electrothrix gigas]